MKKRIMVLPLALFLAYCSGPNNTQTTDTEIDATTTASTTTTTHDYMADATTGVSDESTTVATGIHADRTMNDVRVDHSTSMINPIPTDPNHPMHRHWQRTNAQHWTWDYDYPGFTRPSGEYNAAISGNWTLNMTPSLVTAWKQDNSSSLWLPKGDTYLSASESFSTKPGVETTTGVSVAATDVNSISYNAYNGNMYQMPVLNLYLDNGSFTGHTGCNAISGRMEVSGNSIRFLNTAPSTAIDCLGGFDQGTLLDLLKRINSYAYVGDELQLMQGSEVLLTLKRNGNEASLK